MPPSLPPYLTSGASSRAHHALLVKLHEATSSQEEREIMSKEIARVKALLAIPNQSTARVSESLIVLLHISVMRADTSDDLDFALIHALKLAENGRTVQERRTGYLFVQERMRVGDELGLMLINTIRKDLSSERSAHIMLALHAIVKLPSRDLSPAVTPLLTSKRLLRHPSPAVRQRTVEAINALHLRQRADEYPLSMSKIVKMLSTEEDDSVLLVVIRTLRKLLQFGVRSIGSSEEAGFLTEQTIAVATERSSMSVQVIQETLQVLDQVLASPYGQSCASVVSDFLLGMLPNLEVHKPGQGAILLAICQLAAQASLSNEQISNAIIQQLGVLLQPRPDIPSSSTEPYVPPPNQHVLAIRCLDILPTAIWDGQLGEQEMTVIMEGLNSPDDTIRRATLRLLARLSPELLDVSFENLLSALRSSSDLCLPLHPPSSFEEKTVAGRLETSGRALEVAEIRYRREDGSESADTRVTGGHFAAAFVEILLALNEGVLSSTVVLSQTAGTTQGSQVWEEGLRRVLAILADSSRGFAAGFAEDLVQHRIGSATLAVLRCSILSDTSVDVGRIDEVVPVLLDDLKDFGASVQELILISLVVTIPRSNVDRDAVINSIREVQLDSGKYIKKRCGQVVDLIQQDLLSEVSSSASSSSLPDVLAAMSTVHAAWRRSRRIDDQSTPTNPGSPPRSVRDRPSTLRYDAYDTPGSTREISRSLARSRDTSTSQNGMATSVSAGDLALFDADDEGDERPDRTAGQILSKSRPGPLAVPDPTDPFAGDEARTPTMRGSAQVQAMGHLL